MHYGRVLNIPFLKYKKSFAMLGFLIYLSRNIRKFRYARVMKYKKNSVSGKLENLFVRKHKIHWLQIIDASPKSWKDIILKDKRNVKKLVIFNHHIVRKSQTSSLNKLTSKELYLILADANTAKPTARDYFENLFKTSQFNWKKFFFLIHNTTLDTKALRF